MELYPSRLAAAQAAGISKDTWQRVEEGDEVRPSTYAKIDRALGWATGGCTSIAEGGEPVLVDRPGAGAGGATSPPTPLTPTGARQAVFEAAREALPAAAIGDLDTFSERLVDILRKAGAVKDDD